MDKFERMGAVPDPTDNPHVEAALTAVDFLMAELEAKDALIADLTHRRDNLVGWIRANFPAEKQVSAAFMMGSKNGLLHLVVDGEGWEESTPAIVNEKNAMWYRWLGCVAL